MQKFSYLKSINAAYIDELFDRYSQDPESVDPSWRYFFEGLELGVPAPNGKPAVSPQASPQTSGDTKVPANTPVAPVSVSQSMEIPNGKRKSVAFFSPSAGERKISDVDFSSEAKVAELIVTYREVGRLLAHIDPLNPAPSSHPLLELSRFGLTSNDLTRTFTAGHLLGMGPAPLNLILERLKETYCGSIGVEFTHIQDSTEREWLQGKMEASRNQVKLPPEIQKQILRRITESETFERFLHTRYVAQKRFSAEGAESIIPTLDCLIEAGAALGAQEFVIGMAHRARLNVLAHIFGKKVEHILTEFEGAFKTDSILGEGDVKYHMGYSNDITRNGKKIHLSLASNPSHLEFVNPVIEGIARAKEFLLNDKERLKVIPIAIHGDAAFAGQGVCYETLNLSQLAGYSTGGTIHIVINNQVGFTTSPEDSRSTTYSTDLAKMLEVPIFHVNGDDPEALWYVAQLCAEFRQKFRKDIFIDLVCYRKHGHNEGDEPSFTQPILYKKIKNHPSVREVYAKKLISLGVISQSEEQVLIDEITEQLTQAQVKTRAEAPQPFVSVFEGVWKSLKRPSKEDLFKPVQTQVKDTTLKELAEKLNRTPNDFNLHSKLNRFFEARLKAVREGSGIDWGNAETLAYASLVTEGYPVRLSGQDAERGTFTHRHSVLNDFQTGAKYVPLNHLKEGQAPFEVYNSHLSEVGVLGFEYGYSLANPRALVIWEAQFGDFVNGAQVIIDQFMSAAESKWQRMSGLTLLLPHGFEGQGPEHSSARLERFLQLCGKDNLFVCNLTTPAQIFHALRRQVIRDFRKPLVIMSPKSLLRHPLAVSSLQDLSQSTFEEVLDDPMFASETSKASQVKRVILCSGKIYYDLLASREKKKIQNLALIRIEQIYPWPGEKIARILGRYEKASLLWVQEEPRNMGAWSFVFNMWSGGFSTFQDKVGGRSIQYIGREICAAPAVGSHKIHENEQESIIEKALS